MVEVLIAGWTFGALGDVARLIAGSGRTYRWVTSRLEYRGDGWLCQSNSDAQKFRQNA